MGSAGCCLHAQLPASSVLGHFNNLRFNAIAAADATDGAEPRSAGEELPVLVVFDSP